ncbi:hypothetical protein FOL47_003000 [Perkinsus chesapeaki]|uniref:OBG-type G domain-containing protein n=1 Tax=Perkinsus chesapeaki TaxID=330153 RepID=A0A7J6MZV3_PERCH|nr:hypothetical protein FOL47_003000 [Perkinsus chesapeaki]
MSYYSGSTSGAAPTITATAQDFQVHALEVQLAGVTEERDSLVRRLKKHKFWSSSSSMWVLQLQEKQEEITSLQVKVANLEARLAEVSRNSQPSAAVITPRLLPSSNLVEAECQTDSSMEEGVEETSSEESSPSYFPSIESAAVLKRKVRELQREIELMRPKVSEYYNVSSELKELKGAGIGKGSTEVERVSVAVDTNEFRASENVSTQTDSSVASRGGSQTVAAWQQVGRLRDKLRDTEIALKRSQRQLSDLQEQHARAGAELRASWARREAETSAMAASSQASSKGSSGVECGVENEGRGEELQEALRASQERADSFANQLFTTQEQLSSANGQVLQQRKRMAALAAKVDELSKQLSEQYELAAQGRENEDSLAASRQDVIDQLSDQIRTWVAANRELTQKCQDLQKHVELSRIEAADRASELCLAQARGDKAVSNAQAMKIEYAEISSQLAMTQRQLDELRASQAGIRGDDATTLTIRSQGSSSSGPGSQQGFSFATSSSSATPDGFPIAQASSRQQRFVDGPFWFKLLVPDTVVGMIMGMRGSTIMRLEKENCAVVRFSPYSHYFPGTDKRIIIGATANLSNLYSLVNTVVSDYIFRKNEQTSEIMIVVGSENALNLAVSASSGFLDCSVVTYYDNEWVLSLKPAIEHSEMDPSFLAHVVASVVIAVQVDRDGMVHSSRYLYHPVPNVVKATASSSSINDDNDDDDDIDQLLNAYPWYPNVGKSTTFNAIVGAQLAEAANFPFCTIEPNISKATVPDPLLDELAKVEGSVKKIHGQLEVRDIAGLVKGASEGQGMGNSFLANIRHVNCIIQVVRCFSDAKIAHVDDPINIDPIAEFEAISDELLIADLDMATRKMPGLRKRACAEPEAKKMLPLYESWLKGLEEGVPVRNLIDMDRLIESFGLRVMATDPLLCVLITAKPLLVMANVRPEDVRDGNDYTVALEKHVKDKCSKAADLIVASSILEEETSSLGDPDFLAEYLSSYGLSEPRLPRLMECVKSLLGVSHYYTLGANEARAWFIQKGEKAPAAARYVHTDFEKFFQMAKQCRPEEVLKRGGVSHVRDAGLIKNRGKEYVVQEGDILEFIDRSH